MRSSKKLLSFSVEILKKMKGTPVSVQALLKSFWRLTKRVISLTVDAVKKFRSLRKTSGLFKTRGAKNGATMASSDWQLKTAVVYQV